MPDTVTSSLKFLGVTPWQVLFGVACLGSWWGTMKPLLEMPSQFKELNQLVSAIAVKVEVHSVLIHQMNDLAIEVKTMRKEIANIEGRLAGPAWKTP